LILVIAPGNQIAGNLPKVTGRESESRMQKQQRASGVKAGRERLKGQPLVARGPPHGSEDFPVVGIGASSGGLEACNKLLGALPPDNGMAFILVQHLDPTHESMMAELLAHRTTMTVVQATNGMPLERQHLYIIPPGAYLSVSNGALHLSEPEARHGARLPFDFLLRSLAEGFGERAICVVLSGTGADGSLGLKAVKEKGGLVIAQNPDEAAFDGMPRNAILTGAVDLVLPLRDIPDALIKFHRRMALTRGIASPADGDAAPDWLPEIIDLLRKKRPTISGFTRKARCGDGSSAAWPWHRSKPTIWSDTSMR
jgi:two-component system CheB/CheR fusion protein